jgi:hypothetical protein
MVLIMVGWSSSAFLSRFRQFISISCCINMHRRLHSRL